MTCLRGSGLHGHGLGPDSGKQCDALQVCDEVGLCYQYLFPLFNACLKPATAVFSGIGGGIGGIGGDGDTGEFSSGSTSQSSTTTSSSGMGYSPQDWEVQTHPHE